VSRSLRHWLVVAQVQEAVARTAWGLVVPVKRLALAKTRLGAFGDAARQDLALAFACDVVAAGLDCPLVATVLVVTDDDRAAASLAATGATVVPDLPDAGLNPALAHGADLLRAEDPSLGVATVSADLPAATAAALAAVLGAVPTGGRAFVADRAGTGTTLLAAGPTAALLPAYGSGSAARHRAAGAREVPAEAGLRLDVDTPEDLRAALALGVGTRTAAVAAALTR
jgi:2-phospho-L-lactate/phosphoenolpyruvate guanylyltransferase